jgi:hypothetical protein
VTRGGRRRDREIERERERERRGGGVSDRQKRGERNPRKLNDSLPPSLTTPPLTLIPMSSLLPHFNDAVLVGNMTPLFGGALSVWLPGLKSITTIEEAKKGERGEGEEGEEDEQGRPTADVSSISMAILRQIPDTQEAFFLPVWGEGRQSGVAPGEETVAERPWILELLEADETDATASPRTRLTRHLDHLLSPSPVPIDLRIIEIPMERLGVTGYATVVPLGEDGDPAPSSSSSSSSSPSPSAPRSLTVLLATLPTHHTDILLTIASQASNELGLAATCARSLTLHDPSLFGPA